MQKETNPDTHATIETATDIGSRRELFTDTSLVDSFEGNLTFELHQPVPREIALVTDSPWEGNKCGYVSVLEDTTCYRMYYKANHQEMVPGKVAFERLAVAYAESTDGITWKKPNLGLFEHEGSTANNLIWIGEGDEAKGVHGFTAFKDTNPACRAEDRYKALGAGKKSTEGLYALHSSDGIRWQLSSGDPLHIEGAFDSQNVAFWDNTLKVYVMYFRNFRSDRQRIIQRVESKNFRDWSTPEELHYPRRPFEQLYTNQISPYYRAPHIYVGFPARYIERSWSKSIESLPDLAERRLRASAMERYGAALTDGLFMSSRDGRSFDRRDEAFLRPNGRYPLNWVYGDNYQNYGLVETAGPECGSQRELSMFVTEGYWRGNSTRFRRHTLRLDGFISARGGMDGGVIVTKLIVFKGDSLFCNFATSAAGGVRITLLEENGTIIDGFSSHDGDELIGDDIEYQVHWTRGSNVDSLQGRPIRIRFEMCDADLYSYRFGYQS